jgi:hypothetical protein
MNDLTNFEVHFFINKDNQTWAMRICYNSGTKEQQFIVKSKTAVFMVVDCFLTWIDNDFASKIKTRSK